MKKIQLSVFMIIILLLICEYMILRSQEKIINDMRTRIDGIEISHDNTDFYNELENYKKIVEENKKKVEEIKATKDYQINKINDDIVDVSDRLEAISQMRVVLSNKEIVLFEELVMAEAGGESFECQKAVASVVINRMLHEKFPSTFDGVVYQRNAFSVTFDGALGRTEVTQSVKDAVKLALYDDYSLGALYFMNIDLAISQGYESNVKNMLESLEVVLEIDEVTFLK